MLYDKRWDAKVETKADPFKLGTLIAWLKTMPPQAEYCYFSNGECLLAKYFTAAGFDRVHMWSDSFTHGIDLPPDAGRYEAICLPGFVRLPQGFSIVAKGYDAGGNTFGAALARARKYRDDAL